ncbi:MAG: putative dehydrogenase [Nitrospirae bacterium]|nr:MAG: putative dehydrogenase [Nitrospirota bacterium]
MHRPPLDHNKHVFVEKPLCLYETEAIDIRDRLREKPHLKLSSNLILRRSPRFQTLKKMIMSGDMGDIYYLEGDYNYGRIEKITEGWRGKIEFYSVVYGGGVHMIDLMLWLTQDEIVEVSAYGNGICTKNSQFRYNDLVAALLKFKSGTVGKMTANFGCVFPHFHPLAVYGTKATFINGRKTGELYRSRDPKVEPEAVVAAYPGVNKGDFLFSFIEAILKNSQPEVTAREIFAAMSVCFAIEKAVQRNEVIKVKNLWEEQ